VRYVDPDGRDLNFDDIIKGTTLAMDLYKNRTEDNLLKLNEFVTEKPEFLFFAVSAGELGGIVYECFGEDIGRLNNSLKKKGIDIAGLKVGMDFSKFAKLTTKVDGTGSNKEITLKTNNVLQIGLGHNKDVLLNAGINFTMPLDSGPVNILGYRPDLTKIVPNNFNTGIMFKVKF
jgi:hypothetical protein